MMEKCHYCCGKFTKQILQIFLYIVIAFAVALGFSYLIKVFVWFGTKRWEFNLGSVHVSLIPGIGDLIIGGGTVAAFAIIMCFIEIFKRLLCPIEHHYNERMKDYIINEVINNNNASANQSQAYSGGGGGRNKDNYEEIELDAISTRDKPIDLSSSSSLLFSSDGDNKEVNDSSSSFEAFLNDDDDKYNLKSITEIATTNDINTKRSNKNKKNTHIVIPTHKKKTIK